MPPQKDYYTRHFPYIYTALHTNPQDMDMYHKKTYTPATYNHAPNLLSNHAPTQDMDMEIIHTRRLIHLPPPTRTTFPKHAPLTTPPNHAPTQDIDMYHKETNTPATYNHAL